MDKKYRNNNLKQLVGVKKDMKINIGLIKYQIIVIKIVMYYKK